MTQHEMFPLIAADPVVEANRQLLMQRSQVGIDKYGTTLVNAGLTRRQLLQHGLEEALDLANYLQAEIMRIDEALTKVSVVVG